VGGTNGKGSTVAYLRAALVENGYEVGTFTSPFSNASLTGLTRFTNSTISSFEIG
jgi:folylpolyglutamate synthase/dihydropteroate synthase